MKKILAFADIDHCLIDTRRDPPPEGGEAVAFDEHGKPTGYLTERQKLWLQTLDSVAEIVPTTARSVEGYRRVHLPFSSYAICSFGGVILQPDGTVDPRWRERTERLSVPHHQLLRDVDGWVRTFAQKRFIDVRTKVVVQEGLTLLLEIKHNQKNLDQLQEIHDFLMPQLPDGWKLHINGNYLGLMPPYLGKEMAVSWYLENIAQSPSLVLGMGDSLSDVRFLNICNLAIMPTGSQNFKTLLKEAKS